MDLNQLYSKQRIFLQCAAETGSRVARTRAIAAGDLIAYKIEMRPPKKGVREALAKLPWAMALDVDDRALGVSR